MPKVYTPRRLREKNRWLRSDGKPNFKSRIHDKIPELSPLIRRDVPGVNTSTPILNVCEIMSKLNTRLVPVLTGRGEVVGVVTATDIIDYLGGGLKHNIILNLKLPTIYDILQTPVGKIMTENPVVVDESLKLSKLLELMVNLSLGAVPVVSQNTYVGIITELEILKFLTYKQVGVKVADVMSKEVLSVDENSKLSTAMKLMIKLGVRRLPVTSGDRVIGIFTWKNVIDLIGTHKVFNVLSLKTLDEFASIPVTTVMTPEVILIDPQADIGEAASKILETQTSLLLAYENGKLVGIITERDVIYGLVV